MQSDLPRSSRLSFNGPSTAGIYTLSLHDALPISPGRQVRSGGDALRGANREHPDTLVAGMGRSEEHTSELQSPDHLVCRLLLEKKKTQIDTSSVVHRRWPITQSGPFGSARISRTA